MRKRVWIVSMLFLSTLALGAAASVFAGEMQQKLIEESTIEQIMKRGVLRVGMDVFVPFAMKDKKGELIGFEIDVAKRLAEDMGVKIEFVPTEWSGIIAALITGKFDVIIGGMSVTPERNLKINFSDPYYYGEMALLANKQKSEGLTLQDFNKAGISIAARLGSTAAFAAKANFPKAEIRLFDNEPAAVQEVINGQVHAMVSQQPLPAHKAAESPGTLISYNASLFKEPIGFGVKKGDLDTLNFFNNWIEIVKNKGFIQDRYQYWFLSMDWKKLVE